MSGILTSAGASASSGAKSLSETVSSSLPIPSAQSLTAFAVLLGLGGFFLLFAFFVALPLIVIAPSKFATSFTVGSLCIMGSFGALRGPKQQLEHMLSADRLSFTSVYLGSILGTLYAALVMHSYVLSILCSGVQVVALLYYVMSYFPGGEAGMKAAVGMLGQGFAGCFKVVAVMMR